jgi:hypothetical protein
LNVISEGGLSIVQTTELVCRRCNEIKSITEFDRAFFGKKGYDVYCNNCRTEINEIEDKLHEKRCRQCNRVKKISEFDRNASCRDGYSKECIDCVNENKQRRRARKYSDSWDGKSYTCRMCNAQKPSFEFVRQMDRYGNYKYCRTCISMINRNKTLKFEQARELNGYPIEKRCKICGKLLPADHFHLDRRMKDGLSDKCNDCYSEIHTEWIEKNKEIRAKKSKKKKNKECQICHELRPIHLFNNDKTSKDGYGSQCSVCRKIIQKENVSIWKKQRMEKGIEIIEMECRICKRVLPINKFSKNIEMKSGYYSHCKDCHKKMEKKIEKQWAKNREKEQFEFSLDVDVEKKCKLCGKVRPLSKFWKRKASKDGYSHYCKDCLNKKTKARNKVLKERGFPEELIPDEKDCKKCGRVLTKEHFRKNSLNSTGLDDYCKDCRNEYYKEYSSRPEVKEKKKEYKHRPEVMERSRIRARKYSRRPEVKKRRKAYKKEYRKRDYVKQKKREYNKEYSKRPEVRERKRKYDREYQRRRRKRIKQLKEQVVVK